LLNISKKANSSSQSFFKGFEQEKRGNVEIDFDDELPLRVADPYLEPIAQAAESDLAVIANAALPIDRVNQFVSGMNLATAIKLQKSSSDLEKNNNFKLNVLNTGSISLPEKAAVIINQLGKTDLPNDNRIRIINQSMASKRMLVKALHYNYSDAILTGYFTEMANAGLAIANFRTFLTGPNSHKMIDSTIQGLRLLKSLGRDFFKEKIKTNYQISVNSVTQAQIAAAPAAVAFDIRLPHFEFTANTTVADITAYLNNPLFSLAAGRHFTFTNQQVVVEVVCSLVFQIATLDWLRNPNRTMQALDNNFANTFIAGNTFTQVMNAAGIWNINNFILDSDLNEVAGELLHNWNTVVVPKLKQTIKFQNINFSDFGTDSQLIEINNQYLHNGRVNRGIDTKCIKGKAKSHSVIKTSETGALFGIMCKFNKKVVFTSDFVVTHDSNNLNILREFLKSDII